MGEKVFEFVSPPPVHDKPIGLEEGPTGKALTHLNCTRLSLDNRAQPLTTSQPYNLFRRDPLWCHPPTPHSVFHVATISYPSWWHKQTHNEHSLGSRSSEMWCYVTGWTIPNFWDCSARLTDPKNKGTALLYMNAINQQHSATNHRTWIFSNTAVRIWHLAQAVCTHLFTLTVLKAVS